MKKAFSLIEFLIVVAIMALLVTAIYTHAGKKGVPQKVLTTNNPGYDVQLLFMIDGLKVYRFYDAGRYIYVVDGRNSSTVWNEHQMIGKTETGIPMEVPTIK